MKMTQYPEITTVNDDDILLVANDQNGTRKITAGKLFGSSKTLADSNKSVYIDDANNATNSNVLYSFNSSAANIPFNSYGFIEVLNQYDNHLIQMAHRMNSATPTPYMRSRYNNPNGDGTAVWSEWKPLATSADVAAVNSKIGNFQGLRDLTNNTEYTFEVPKHGTGYCHFIIYGGTSFERMFAYLGFVGTDNAVYFRKIFDDNESRTFTGTYNGTNLTIVCSNILYGGISLIWNN